MLFQDISMQIMKPHYIIWRVCGIWPLPSDNMLYRVYCIFMHITCFFLFNLVILLGIGHANGMNDVIDIILPSTTLVLVSIKSLLLLRNQAKVKVLFDIIQQLEVSTKNMPLERAIMQQNKRSITKLFIGLNIGCFASLLMIFIATILSNPRKLLWDSYVPFEWEHTGSTKPYWIAMTFQTSCNFFLAILYSTVDGSGPSLFSIFTTFLEILGSRLENIGKQKTINLTEDDYVYAEEELHECIRYHSLCLRYIRFCTFRCSSIQCYILSFFLFRGIQCLNDIFSVHYTTQFFASGILICVTAYQLSVVWKKIASKENLIWIKIQIIFFIGLADQRDVQVFVSCFLYWKYGFSVIHSVLLW